MHEERVKRGTEEALDVLGAIGEVIADGETPTVVGDDPASITMDQAADKLLVRLSNEALLPSNQRDRAQMLPAGAMLGEQAWPVCVVGGDLGASIISVLAHPDAIRRTYSADRGDTFLDDAWIARVERDPELVSARVLGDASVTEVHTE